MISACPVNACWQRKACHPVGTSNYLLANPERSPYVRAALFPAVPYAHLHADVSKFL